MPDLFAGIMSVFGLVFMLVYFAIVIAVLVTFFKMARHVREIRDALVDQRVLATSPLPPQPPPPA